MPKQFKTRREYLDYVINDMDLKSASEIMGVKVKWGTDYLYNEVYDTACALGLAGINYAHDDNWFMDNKPEDEMNLIRAGISPPIVCCPIKSCGEYNKYLDEIIVHINDYHSKGVKSCKQILSKIVLS